MHAEPHPGEAQSPSVGARAALSRRLAQGLAVLLALQLGVVSGLLVQRLRRPRPAPAAPAQAQAQAQTAPPVAAAVPPPAPRGAAALLVDVVDGAGAPQRGATVVALPVDDRGRPPAPAAEGLTPVGELGVLKGKLPLTGDVIAGRVSPPTLGAVGIRAVTDARGTARLEGLPPGRLQVQCVHLGQQAAAEIVIPPGARPEAAARLVLRLGAAPVALAPPEPAAPPLDPTAPPEPQGPILGVARDIQGLVLDERGLGLPRARVEAQGPGGVRRAAGTDAGGRFTLVAVPQGPVTILCQHAGFAPLSLTPDEDALRAPLRLQLQPGAGIEGTVRERRLGGVPERLQLVLRSGALRVPIAVGRDGRFLHTGLPPGDATLRAEAPGYVPQERRLQLAAADHPDAVTLRDLVLELDLAGTVVGQLRDRGAPVPRAAVRALDEGGAEVGRAVTDSDGRFRLGALPAGRLQLEARAAAGRAEERIEVRSGDEARVDLDLR